MAIADILSLIATKTLIRSVCLARSLCAARPRTANPWWHTQCTIRLLPCLLGNNAKSSNQTYACRVLRGAFFCFGCAHAQGLQANRGGLTRTQTSPRTPMGSVPCSPLTGNERFFLDKIDLVSDLYLVTLSYSGKMDALTKASPASTIESYR